MFAFGLNSDGRLGMETGNEKQYEPLEIQFKSSMSKIYAGGYQSFIFE